MGHYARKASGSSEGIGVLMNEDVYVNVMAECNELWGETKPLSQELINAYAQKINFAIERWDMDYNLAEQRIQPNYMQKKALRELNRVQVLHRA